MEYDTDYKILVFESDKDKPTFDMMGVSNLVIQKHKDTSSFTVTKNRFGQSGTGHLMSEFQTLVTNWKILQGYDPTEKDVSLIILNKINLVLNDLCNKFTSIWIHDVEFYEAKRLLLKSYFCSFAECGEYTARYDEEKQSFELIKSYRFSN